MKKRYYLTPILLIAVAAVWNITFRQSTRHVEAETMQEYLQPKVRDPRHPIEVFHLGVQSGETENDVLAHIPAQIYPEDNVRFMVDPRLGIGTIVHIERAMPITVTDGKKVVAVRTWANTVGELLDDIRRPLVDLDRANYETKALLQPNMAIEITRVSKLIVTEKESIPFEIITRDDPEVDRPQTKVKEEGKNGERTKTYEITREDGEIVAKKLVKNEITTKPKQKVIVKGTRIKVGKTQVGKATWYDLCCKKVASNTFKKGTVLRLTNLNNGKKIEVTVDDTGGFDGNNIVVDLHPDYFKQLGGTLGQGILERIQAEEILNP